jgi:hypothetical protein
VNAFPSLSTPDKVAHVIESKSIQDDSSVHALGCSLGNTEGCKDGDELAKSDGPELGLSLITEGEIDKEGTEDGIRDGTVDGAIGTNLDPPHKQQASPTLFPKL